MSRRPFNSRPSSTLTPIATRNAAHHRTPAEDLRAKTARVGPERSRTRHVERGKLLPRDRVEALLDPGTPLLELSPLAAHGMYDGDAPGAGIITAVGQVAGTTCVVVGVAHPLSSVAHDGDGDRTMYEGHLGEAHPVRSDRMSHLEAERG